MDELVGNTDGFAESGSVEHSPARTRSLMLTSACSVSSAIVQRYLPQILEAALSSQVRIQAVAVDILGFTIRQGLAHPLQVIAALLLHMIHADSFTVSTRHCCSRDESEYQSQLTCQRSPRHFVQQTCVIGQHSLYGVRAQVLRVPAQDSSGRCPRSSSRFFFGPSELLTSLAGYRLTPTPTALLHRWYSLVREKRPTRQEFLKAILKCFDVDSTAPSASQVRAKSFDA